MNTDINSMSIEELRILKQSIAELIKEKTQKEKWFKELLKLNIATIARETLSVKDVVFFTYKGEECEGEITKLSDKTFTVMFTYEGEGKVLSRSYNLFVRKESNEDIG